MFREHIVDIKAFSCITQQSLVDTLSRLNSKRDSNTRFKSTDHWTTNAAPWSYHSLSKIGWGSFTLVNVDWVDTEYKSYLTFIENESKGLRLNFPIIALTEKSVGETIHNDKRWHVRQNKLFLAIYFFVWMKLHFEVWYCEKFLRYLIL